MYFLMCCLFLLGQMAFVLVFLIGEVVIVLMFIVLMSLALIPLNDVAVLYSRVSLG